MTEKFDAARRRLLLNIAAGAAAPLGFAAIGNAFAAPLLTADDPTAKALHYTEDASKSTTVKKGSHCGTCALYQGAAGSAQGACAIFAGKDVKSGAVCDSWAAKS